MPDTAAVLASAQKEGHFRLGGFTSGGGSNQAEGGEGGEGGGAQKKGGHDGSTAPFSPPLTTPAAPENSGEGRVFFNKQNQNIELENVRSEGDGRALRYPHTRSALFEKSAPHYDEAV